jgi:cation:H+ antiporter
VILLASVLFTNAIEVLGKRLGASEGVVGSILAAVGTAMPETVIPLIAIFWVGDIQAKDVAVGAIAGAPFMLATLAFFVTGAAVAVYGFTGRRERGVNADLRGFKRDLSFFVVLYAAALSTTFVHVFALRVAVAACLAASYVVYVKVTVSAEALSLGDVEKLYFARVTRLGESTTLTCVQLAASLAVMMLGGHMFVVEVEQLACLAGVSPLVLSLILAPVATELPEKFNSVIWVGRGKDTLALGNITGAMVFQCSFPVAIGIVWTPWNLLENKGVTFSSGVLALSSALGVLAWVRLRGTLPRWVLMMGGVFYAAFIAFVLIHVR